jgi:hypothetical protein
MGLAYNLNVEPLQSITDWAEVMNQGDSNLWLGSSIDGDRRGRSSSVPAGDIRIPEVSDSDYDEFDIIIRNTTYVQDHYIVVGSYRAFFSSLNGGAGAWAWDGFVTIIRAHNLGFKSAMWFEQTYPGSFPPTTSDKYWLNPGFVDGFVINQPFDELNEYWTYLCRMPYECDPGLTGIGSDSTPGVYAVDSAKRFIQGAQIIKIVVGGHSRINTAVEGGLTGQDYSAWFSNLSFNIISPTITYRRAEPADCTRRYTLEFMSGDSGTISINGSTNIGTGLPSTNLAPAKKQNISTQCKSSNTVAGGITTVPITGLNNNYYPTR